MLIFSRHSYDLNGGASTTYFSPVHIEENNTEDYDVVGVIPVACTMTNLAVKVGTGMEAGVTATFTLRKGATLGTMADTTLGCAVTSVATFCTDTDTLSMSAGDLFSFKVTYGAGSTGGDNIFLTDLICQ